jgi:hypothetical protein
MHQADLDIDARAVLASLLSLPSDQQLTAALDLLARARPHDPILKELTDQALVQQFDILAKRAVTAVLPGNHGEVHRDLGEGVLRLLTPTSWNNSPNWTGRISTSPIAPKPSPGPARGWVTSRPRPPGARKPTCCTRPPSASTPGCWRPTRPTPTTGATFAVAHSWLAGLDRDAGRVEQAARDTGDTWRGCRS